MFSVRDLPGEGLVSSPVPVRLPGERDWADRAAEWALWAREAARCGDGAVP